MKGGDTKGDDQRMMERYVLAVFYYATHPSKGKKPTNPSMVARATHNRYYQPPNGTDGKLEGHQQHRDLAYPEPSSTGTNASDEWMKVDEVCQWKGIRCDKDQYITHLKLPHEHLRGSLPSELQGLTVSMMM